MFKRVLANGCKLLVFILVLIGLGCTEKWGEGAHDISLVAGNAAQEVGTVETVGSRGTAGPVFAFEEFHTSRVGQLQIALMLVRLYHQHQIKNIGLEGAIQRPLPIDGTWFQNAGGLEARSAREDVAVRMLSDGEISSAEFMTLLFPDVKVYGTETQEEYQVSPAEGGGEIGYLLAIAQTALAPTDVQQVNALLQEKKHKEALEYMLTADPWVKQKYEILKNPSAASAEAVVSLIQEIQTKADQVRANIDPKDKEGLLQDLHFYQIASQRSQTMVAYTLGLPGLGSGEPRAMIIGAAHADRVAELYKQRSTMFALIKPLAFNPAYGQLSFKQFERKGIGKWAHASQGSLGSLLNSPHKPPPIIETASAKSYASMHLASLLIARSAGGGGRVPDDVWPQIANLPELRVDRSSFSVLGYDVVFRASLKKTDGSKIDVWARVASLRNEGAAATLEQKLLQAIADLGGGGQMPPNNPPPNSARAKDEGPGDGKRGKVVISRIGLHDLAVYGSSRTQVLRVGQLSG